MLCRASLSKQSLTKCYHVDQHPWWVARDEDDLRTIFFFSQAAQRWTIQAPDAYWEAPRELFLKFRSLTNTPIL